MRDRDQHHLGAGEAGLGETGDDFCVNGVDVDLAHGPEQDRDAAGRLVDLVLAMLRCRPNGEPTTNGWTVTPPG